MSSASTQTAAIRTLQRESGVPAAAEIAREVERMLGMNTCDVTVAYDGVSSDADNAVFTVTVTNPAEA